MGESLRITQEALDAFNAHDEERIRAGYAPNAVFEAPGDIRLEGPEAITDYAMGWLAAFPDARVTVDEQIEAGEWVVYRCVFEGTHENAMQTPEGEVPATHRRVKGRAAELCRVENGKIAAEYLYYDQMEILTQLGLVPETSATA
jgi:steroid delta-isomerase-like uncharacterized protein